MKKEYFLIELMREYGLHKMYVWHTDKQIVQMGVEVLPGYLILNTKDNIALDRVEADVRSKYPTCIREIGNLEYMLKCVKKYLRITDVEDKREARDYLRNNSLILKLMLKDNVLRTVALRAITEYHITFVVYDEEKKHSGRYLSRTGYSHIVSLQSQGFKPDEKWYEQFKRGN